MKLKVSYCQKLISQFLMVFRPIKVQKLPATILRHCFLSKETGRGAADELVPAQLLG